MKKCISLFLVLTVVTCIITGCGPVKLPKYVKIKPNETAFVIPLQGNNLDSQKKMWSKEFLEKRKVSTKRIELPQSQEKTGRFSWSYRWKLDAEVIKVDRTPVSREWVSEPKKGTSPNDDSFTVESIDSVSFYMGGTVDCMVTEEDTALFLYRLNGRTLSEIADTNIRRYIAGILVREFGKRSIDKCKMEKSEVFKIAFKETKNHFKPFGITINNVGMIGELSYTNKQIQKAIDDKINAEMAVKRAQEEKKKQIIDAEREAQKLLIEQRNKVELAKQQQLIQEIENKKEKSIADKDLYVAQQKQKAIKTLKVFKELEIQKIYAEATKTYAERWNGSYPNSIIPENSNVLFGNGLYSAKHTKSVKIKK